MILLGLLLPRSVVKCCLSQRAQFCFVFIYFFRVLLLYILSSGYVCLFSFLMVVEDCFFFIYSLSVRFVVHDFFVCF